MHDSLLQLKYVLPPLHDSLPQIKNIFTSPAQLFTLNKVYFYIRVRFFPSDRKYSYLSYPILYLKWKIFLPFMHDSLPQMKYVLQPLHDSLP